MMKVLIADDEPRVCSLIQALANWDALGLTVVGMAHNGLEALALIQSQQPDIVITDIRMPGCTGLELIQRARELCESIDFIIISGHAHFEYAQTAIKYGVGDYLLKPINRDELTATLQKLRDKRLARTEEHARTQQLLQRSENDRLKLRAGLFSNVLLAEPPVPVPERERLNEEYYYTFEPGLFLAFVLKLDFEGGAYNEAASAILEERARELLNLSLRGCCSDAELFFRGFTGYGVCAFSPALRQETRSRFKDYIDQLGAQRALFPGLEFTLGAGRAVEVTVELTASLADARRAVAERLLEGGGRLLEQVPPASTLPADALAEEFSRSAQAAVELLDLDGALAAARALCDRALAVPGVCGRELYALIREAGRRFALHAGSEISETLLAAFLRDCSVCGTAAALQGRLERFLSDVLEQLGADRRQADTRPIRLAKQFIQEHFMEPITLEQVSEEVGFNASYFSALFKKDCGMGFLEYLSETRVNHAKELLRETNLPVAEICSRVGYSDSKHFTKTFARYTGLKPGEFRKLYG